jgi:3-hydroxyacyl-CoA dehydrogenase
VIKTLYAASDDGGRLIKQHLIGLFSYVSHRIPEISDSIQSIDDALKAGFAWSYGPFEYWDIIGVAQGAADAKASGLTISPWVEKMIADGVDSFYSFKDGKPQVYSPILSTYTELPGADTRINLPTLKNQSPVYKNDEAVLHDIGDGVLCFEFKSKANVIGEGILRGLNESIRIAEDEGWKGLVIGNHATNFSVGANLMLIGMMAFQEEWDDLEMAVNFFQQTSMRCRYSSIPVVSSTQGYVFGGGCEISMHCDSVVAAAESYIGQVEAGVGLIPGGGGTKEFALRLSASFRTGDVQIPQLIERCRNLATAAVGTSAYEAFDLGFLLKGRDEVVINSMHNISEAKRKVLELSQNYVTPIPKSDILVLGRQGLASAYAFANEFRLGAFGSDHDIKIVHKLAWVLCGGDLTGAQQVTEQYLLDLEREAFLSLCGEQKTLQRIQYMLENNKPLRN